MSKGDRRDGAQPSRGASTMIIDLEALQNGDEGHSHGPYSLDAPVPRDWLQATLERTDAEVADEGRVTGEITVMSPVSVLVRGRLQAGFSVPCARCLEDAQVSADADLCVQYERGASVEGAPGAEDDDEDVDPDEPDRFGFDGTHIDLRPMLAETVLMAYPIRALCERGEDCRGLCTNCGANLNEQASADGGCAVCGVGGMVGGIGSVPGAEGEGDDIDTEVDSPWKAALRKLRTD